MIDWGEAFKNGMEPSRLAQPGDLMAPETIFTGHFDHRIDLWRAGCIVSVVIKSLLSVMLIIMQIYSLIFAARPFQYLGDDSVLVVQMIGFVEELPDQWKNKWETMPKRSSHSSANTLPGDGSISDQAFKLETRFHEIVNDPELMPLLPVIRGLMRFLPSDRLTAAEALKLLDMPDT